MCFIIPQDKSYMGPRLAEHWGLVFPVPLFHSEKRHNKVNQVSLSVHRSDSLWDELEFRLSCQEFLSFSDVGWVANNPRRLTWTSSSEEFGPSEWPQPITTHRNWARPQNRWSDSRPTYVGWTGHVWLSLFFRPRHLPRGSSWQLNYPPPSLFFLPLVHFLFPARPPASISAGPSFPHALEVELPALASQLSLCLRSPPSLSCPRLPCAPHANFSSSSPLKHACHPHLRLTCYPALLLFHFWSISTVSLFQNSFARFPRRAARVSRSTYVIRVQHLHFFFFWFWWWLEGIGGGGRSMEDKGSLRAEDCEVGRCDFLPLHWRMLWCLGCSR